MFDVIKNLFLKLILIITVVLLNACAKPDVMNVVKIDDKNLNCEQLNLAILDAQEFKKKAEKVKGETGKNYARAVFFWPSLLGTYSNANEAIIAANKRSIHIVNIMKKRNCKNVDQVMNKAQIRTTSLKNLTKQLEKLHKLHKSGAITDKEYKKFKKKILYSY